MVLQSHLPSALLLFALIAGAGVEGQSGTYVVHVGCNADDYKSVILYITVALGKYAYIYGCASREGEFGGAGIPSNFIQLRFKDCNIKWDTVYVVYVTDIQGIVQVTDVKTMFLCRRNTSPITAQAGITVTRATTPAVIPGIAALDSDVAETAVMGFTQPTVLMKITDESSDRTGEILTRAAVGDVVRLHMWVNEAFTGDNGGFDIMVKTIEVSNGGRSLVLTGVDGQGTYDGCRSKSYWAEIKDMGPGYAMVEFSVFMFVPSTTPVETQIFTADVQVCVGFECPNYNCSTNGLDGSASQAGRRRRDLSNDGYTHNMHANTQITIVANTASKAEPYRDDDDDDQVDCTDEPIQEDEVCLPRSEVYGITVSLVIALILSLAINCFLVFRVRKAVRPRDETDSLNFTEDETEVKTTGANT